MSVQEDSVNAAGHRIQAVWSVSFDGKDALVTGMTDGKPDTAGADTVSAKKIDDFTFEFTFKRGVKLAFVALTVIAKDGKTRTATRTGTSQASRIRM